MLKSGREKELWQDVTPDMMSDEEQIGENYVRHQPSYRSDALNKFITKLDNRGDKKMSAHPRTKRTMGSPRKLCPPSHARKWTVKNERIHSATEQDGSEDTSTTTMATINEDAITPPQSMASEAELDSIEDSDSEFSVNNDDEAIESSDTD